MYLIVEVVFYSNKRKSLPLSGYRPDAVFNGKDYWGITFKELVIDDFDVPTVASIKFTFQDSHYDEITTGQKFKIMEGQNQVGNGMIVSIENEV